MVRFNDVTKRYQNTTALDHITMELKENKIYCLLGRNGAGKTTLLKLIAGHINASSGKIEVDDKPVSTLNMPECVNFIESRASQFNLKVESLIKIAKQLDEDFDMDFALTVLQKFRLDKKKRYRQLSFGMQTMLTTLMSLASNSKVVILDEPVLGFDAVMRSQFYELLTDSFENHPRLIIVSTHLIDEIAKSAEQLIILDGGKILLQSTINEIDEKAYSITGMTRDVKPALDGLNVIGQKTIGGFTTAFIYDRRIDVPGNLTMQALGLQEFFISMVGGNSDEDQF
jgi:ABC-type multidrug transport system, ATPase component